MNYKRHEWPLQNLTAPRNHTHSRLAPRESLSLDWPQQPCKVDKKERIQIRASRGAWNPDRAGFTPKLAGHFVHTAKALMKISLGASQAAKVLEINSVFSHGGGQLGCVCVAVCV